MSRISFSDSILLADGKKIAIKFMGSDSFYLLEDYCVLNTQISYHTDYHATSLLDKSFRYSPSSRASISLEIESFGGFSAVSAEDMGGLFQNAASMSVNELLAAAFKKMEERSI